MFFVCVVCSWLTDFLSALFWEGRVQPQCLPLHIRVRQCLANKEGSLDHRNTYITTQQLHIHSFLFYLWLRRSCLFVETDTPCWYYRFIRPCAHVSRIYVFLHLWWRFYSVINPCMQRVCVCVCVMEPHSGNLVESGTSRLSSCQMQQILFQYRAWVFRKHSHIHQHQPVYHFCSIHSKCKVNWFSSSRAIYTVYQAIFHTTYTIWMTF